LLLPTVDHVTIPSDASVVYFFTYFAELIACNTETFSVSRSPGQGGLVIASGVCPAIEYNATFSRGGVDNDTLAVIFTSTTKNRTVEFVDLHVSINTALLSDGNGAYSPEYNYRMNKLNGTTQPTFDYVFPGPDGVVVSHTSYVDFFFTYCSEHTDCNTLKSTFGGESAVQTVVRAQYGTTNRATGFGANGDIVAALFALGNVMMVLAA